MTAGAVGSMAICRRQLGLKVTNDPKVQAGIRWLADNFSVAEHPGLSARHHYYYLYALERAGAFLETEKIGDHEWYREGAAWLLSNQKEGSWIQQEPGSVPRLPDSQELLRLKDTSFALLFLRRATAPPKEEDQDAKDDAERGGKK
jgi:hypothetical protein